MMPTTNHPRGDIMRTTILLAAAILALAGCSASDDGDSGPSTPAPSATSTAPTETPVADRITACTDAIVAGTGQDGPECAGLSADDVFKAVQDANQRGRDALQSQLDAATTQP